jgi:hypothetical protein
MERADVHDNPFDPRSRFAGSGCACGRHVNPVEHDRDTAPSLQCASVDSPENSDEKRYEGVVASGVMRAMFRRHPCCAFAASKEFVTGSPSTYSPKARNRPAMSVAS